MKKYIYILYIKHDISTNKSYASQYTKILNMEKTSFFKEGTLQMMFLEHSKTSKTHKIE